MKSLTASRPFLAKADTTVFRSSPGNAGVRLKEENMHLCFSRFRQLRTTLAGAVLMTMLAPAAPAGEPLAFGLPFRKQACPPACPQYDPCPVPMHQAPTLPPTKEDPKKEDPKKEDPITQPTTPDPSSSLATAPESGLALGGEGGALASSNVGYIDNAIPRTQYRFRYDSAYRNNRPDRAEFFYAKCGCFKTVGLDPQADGPPLPETNVDYQDLTNYIEYAFSNRFSAFVDLPVRILNPTVNANAYGFADMIAGFKTAIVAEQDRYVTFQLKGYFPSGDSDRGLGTNHYSVEPGLLFYQGLSERMTFEGEVRYWVPIGGTNFAGQVVRYGAGLSYQVVKTCDWNLSPVIETVGWSVLNGKQFDGLTGAVSEAGGNFILNAKAGLRFNYGEHISVYGGYGRALTGAVWYKDLARVELRLSF